MTAAMGVVAAPLSPTLGRTATTVCAGGVTKRFKKTIQVTQANFI